MPGTRHSARRKKRDASPETIARQVVTRNCDEKKFSVGRFPGKGRGVVANTSFEKGDFLVHYAGTLRSAQDGNKLEEQSPSCYRYFFHYEGKEWCMDATEEPAEGPCLGRLVNHGTRRELNAKMKVITVNHTPALCLFAVRDIQKGEELLYDYGIKELPWKSDKKIKPQCQDIQKDTPANKLDSFNLEDMIPSSNTEGAAEQRPSDSIALERKKGTGDGNSCEEQEAENEPVELRNDGQDKMEEEPPTGRLRNDERELRSQTECQDSLNDTLPANGDCSSLEHTTPSHDKREVVEGKHADLLILRLPKVSGERSSCEEQESANEPIQLRSDVGNEEKEEEPFPSSLKIKESELRSQTECQDSLNDTLPANADCSSLEHTTPSHDKRSVVEGKQADLMVLRPPEDSGEGSSCEEQESENEPIELRSDVGNEEKDEEKFPSSFKIKERELRSQTECQDSLKDTLPVNADCSSLGNMTPLHDKRSVVEGKQADLMVLKPPEDSGKGSSSETQESESEPEEVIRRVGDVSEEKQMESFIHSMRIEGELGNQTESQGLPEDTQFDQMDCFDSENVIPSDEEDSSLNRQGYLMLLDISKGTDEDVSSEEENFKFALIQGEGNCDTTEKTTKEGDEQSTISSSESEEDPFCAPQFGRNCDKTRKNTKDEQSTSSSSDSEEDPSYAPHSDVESDGSQEDPSYAPHSDVESDGSQEFPFYNKKANSPCPVTSTSEDTKPTNQPSTSSYKKPYRLCIFCDSMKSKLSEHIAKQHHNIDRVALALKLATREKRQAFDRFKKEGILKFNKHQAKCSKPAYHRERSSVIENLVMCNICSGFYAKRYIRRHLEFCQSQSEGCSASLPIPVHLLANEEICSESFVENVLNRFRPDEVGTLCTKDPVVLMIGKRLWEKQKRKMDKKTEVRRSVMTDMRRLSALYLEMKTTEKVLGEFPCKNGDAGDIFKRNNFRHLEEAISSLTTSESSSGSDLKAGLKLGIYYLLKSAAKIMKGTYLIDDQDNLAEDVDKFVQVLELSNNFLFGDATYKINQQRQVKLRKPDVLPLESDVKKLRDYTVTRMHEITSDELEVWDTHRFVELRDLVVCRLTLFNARRGGEPSRLLIREWTDAEKGVWLDKQQLENLDPLDKALADTLKIAYQSGKGNKHLVPILFPPDTVEAMKKLTDEEIRRNATVDDTNPFVFASINQSDNHVSGWHAVSSVCDNVTLTNKSIVTATKNRHRVSTMFALMDVPENDRQFIYKHLGHSEETNKNIYQTPLALKELTVVGSRLQTIDEGEEALACTPGTSYANTEPLELTSKGGNGITATEEEEKEEEACCVNSEEDLPGELPENYSTKEQLYKPARKYCKWTPKQTAIVRDYFKDYLHGRAEKKLPGRNDVLAFLKVHDNFGHDWKTIKTKVMNEVNKLQKMSKQREKGWQ